LLPQSGKILFSQRDCFYLYLVYKAITNNLNCDMLDVSRRGYYAPFNEDYINYIFNKTKDALIVDSHGTGSSANHFFKHNDIDFNLYHIFKHPIKKGNVDTNTLTWNKICNRSFNCYGRFFEKYNINHSGVLIDWVENKAVRKKSEHDKDSCDTVKECIDFLLKHIHQYNNCNYNVLNFNFLIKELSGTFTEQFINTIGK
jgi:arsenate reductase-like glutaredoxin family protein